MTPMPTTGGTGGGNATSGDCKCGLAKRTSRIVGGVESEVNEWPWQVAMVWKGSSGAFCGGMVISDQWVLTASHCVDGTAASSIQVLLGEHDYYDNNESNMVRAGISKIIMHEDYNSQTTDYDFALLKLKTKIDWTATPHIRPVCLPSADAGDFTGDTAYVTGWGTLASGGSTSNVLREVDVEVISNSQCKNAYGSSISARMLCAITAGGQGGKDACQGDSGGPLVSSGTGDGVTAGQNYDLVGVVSWGAGCADKDYPGVYARVTDQVAWIQSKSKYSQGTCPRA